MDLILWRHAEASDAESGEDDLARALTPRGERQAKRMAEWLNRFLPQSARVLVSPALRTCQTAEPLGRKLRVVETLAPGATAVQLLAAAHWPDSPRPVLLVGHQPALGEVVALLLGGDEAARAGSWAMRKGAVWWLRRRVKLGASEVALVCSQSPDML